MTSTTWNDPRLEPRYSNDRPSSPRPRRRAIGVFMRFPLLLVAWACTVTPQTPTAVPIPPASPPPSPFTPIRPDTGPDIVVEAYYTGTTSEGSFNCTFVAPWGLDDSYWADWQNFGNCDPLPIDVIWVSASDTTNAFIRIPETCGDVESALLDPTMVANDGRADCQPLFAGELPPCQQ